ncbi:MAG: hypothetical protein ACU0BB_10700 [Paracoccaceae bacterium]
MKLTDLDTETRVQLKPRRAPYTLNIKTGLYLLCYRAKTADRWGVRTAHGDRVIGDATDMTY